MDTTVENTNEPVTRPATDGKCSLVNQRDLRRVPRQYPTCKDEVRLIAEYLAARLDEATIEAFEKHLRQCADCAAFLNTYKKTIEISRSVLRSRSGGDPARSAEVLAKRLGLLARYYSLCIFLISTSL